MPIIEFDNVAFTYNAGMEGEVKAVSGVSFSIEEGEFVALVGHNGSGKSTVARLMNGLLLPDVGAVRVDGMSTADKKHLFDIRKTVGVVFQNPDNQMIATIIEDDVAFGPENLGLPPAEIRARVDWALDAVGMSDHKRGTPFQVKRRAEAARRHCGRARHTAARHGARRGHRHARPERTGRGDARGDRLEPRAQDDRRHDHAFHGGGGRGRPHYRHEGRRHTAERRPEVFGRTAEIRAAGLELPLPSRIADKLRRDGVPLPGGILTDAELTEALCRLR